MTSDTLGGLDGDWETLRPSECTWRPKEKETQETLQHRYTEILPHIGPSLFSLSLSSYSF